MLAEGEFVFDASQVSDRHIFNLFRDIIADWKVF